MQTTREEASPRLMFVMESPEVEEGGAGVSLALLVSLFLGDSGYTASRTGSEVEDGEGNGSNI